MIGTREVNAQAPLNPCLASQHSLLGTTMLRKDEKDTQSKKQGVQSKGSSHEPISGCHEAAYHS